MKYLKMLGLAAIAAMGLMAFVGAGTASATTLFTNSNNTSPYPAGTTIHATLEPGTSAILESGSTIIATCTSSTVHGDTTNETGTWIDGPITSLKFEECSQTTHVLATGSLEIMDTGGNTGEVWGKGNSVTLGVFGTSCTYGTGEGVKLGTITGGQEPTLKIDATIPRTAGGFLCPSTGTWTASYLVTSPHAVYVGA
jgi:hypothetical protein